MNDYLTKQIITYIGNKRALLPYLETILQDIIKLENYRKLTCADLFSGSGIVARLFKQYGCNVIVNDLEEYSYVINDCYLSNKSSFIMEEYDEWFDVIQAQLDNKIYVKGIISKHYAPADDKNIQPNERCFYTTENAQIIDTINHYIDEMPYYLHPYFLGPLLYQASVHVNTSGVFKGFYKNKDTGVGQYGGHNQNALSRIRGKIELQKPVLCNVKTEYEIIKRDAVWLSDKIKCDVAYLDPPYNQHPYGSNYFMLNVIAANELDSNNISTVSGIPDNWNRSVFNNKNTAKDALEEMVSNLSAKYIIVSYNSEGFISYDEMIDMLNKYGICKVKEIDYNVFRGSRNLKNRNKHLKEYLFVLRKGL